MAKDNNQPENIGSPPAYPPPVHQDAGPAPANFDPRAGPPPGVGGFGSPPPGGYGSPAPGGFHSPMPGGPYGPPAPQQGYYGPPGPPPQGMYYGPQGGPQGPGPYGPGPYGPQQGYRQYSQYERDRSRQNDGICAGILGALACCCCLDILF